jgi:hypothetical protein
VGVFPCPWISGRHGSPVGLDFLEFASFLVHLFLHSQLIQNLWNLLEISKLCMEHSAKLCLFPRSWRIQCVLMDVNTPPSLDFCSFSSKATTLGLVDQELRRCSHSASTLSTTYYSNPYVLEYVGSYIGFRSVGLTRISSLVLGSWETEPTSLEYFMLTVQVLYQILQVFKRGLRFSPHLVLSNRTRCIVLTMVWIFYHLVPTLRLICGVMGRKSVEHLGYLYCRTEEWFAWGCYSIKSRSYGR